MTAPDVVRHPLPRTYSAWEAAARVGGLGPAWAVTALAAGWLAYVGRFWLSDPPPLTSADDGVDYVAAALHRRDPSLFAGDWSFQALAPVVEPLLYTRSLAVILPAWDSPEAMFRALSALLLAIFSLGVWALVRAVTGRTAVALLAALIALRPRMALLTEWGIVMGQPLARSVIMAAAPWLLLWIWRARSGVLHLASPGLAIGLSAAIHPLSALQLGLVALLQECFMAWRVRAIAALGGGIAIGALPALIHHASLLSDRPAPAWFLRLRNPELLPEGMPALVGPLVYDFGVPLLLFLLSVRASRVCLPPSTVRWLRAGASAALVLTLATVAAPLAPALGRFSLGRASGFLYLFLSVPILSVAVSRWMAGGVSPRLAAVALVGGLALSTGSWWDAALDRTLSASGLGLPPRVSWHTFRAPDPLPPLSARAPAHEPRAFRDLADWLSRQTPPEALLLAAPGDAAALRLYARRAVVVATKDAGLFIFSAAKAVAWYARFQDVVQGYASEEPSRLVAVARRYGASHIIVAPGTPPMPLGKVFENAGYAVYAMDGSP